MKDKLLMVSVVGAVVLGLLVYLFVYNVRVDQVVAHYRAGKVVKVVRPDLGIGARTAEAPTGVTLDTRAGWHFKLPFDSIESYDQRVRHVDGVLTQTQLSDGNQVSPRLYATWRIVDPLAFKGSVDGDAERASADLKTFITNEGIQVFGDYTLDQIVNSDPERLKFDTIEDEIFQAVKSDLARAEKAYGIEVCSLGITWIALPEAATRDVFGRMQAERQTETTKILKAGDREKRTLVAKAREQRERILADANAYAKRERAKGEALAAASYDVFRAAPELAIFLRELEAMRTLFRAAAEKGEPIKIILTPDSPPVRLLKEGPMGSGLGDGALPPVPSLMVPTPAAEAGEGGE